MCKRKTLWLSNAIAWEGEGESPPESRFELALEVWLEFPPVQQRWGLSGRK